MLARSLRHRRCFDHSEALIPKKEKSVHSTAPLTFSRALCFSYYYSRGAKNGPRSRERKFANGTRSELALRRGDRSGWCILAISSKNLVENRKSYVLKILKSEMTPRGGGTKMTPTRDRPPWPAHCPSGHPGGFGPPPRYVRGGAATLAGRFN